MLCGAGVVGVVGGVVPKPPADEGTMVDVVRVVGVVGGVVTKPPADGGTVVAGAVNARWQVRLWEWCLWPLMGTVVAEWAVPAREEG